MNTNNESKRKSIERRKLLGLAGVAGGVAVSGTWSKPLVNAVVLPAHAQTSMCMADTFTGGPLLGNASGAMTCQAACEAEATSQSAQLCDVRETVDGMGATQCECDLDT